ncbi:MAG TPA: sialidase family protein, partial [Solirubrobacteraceae bacterium]|nr:sialidase family protein [Solirubrobacteraceae bacterium]
GFLPGLTATSGFGGITGAPFERVSDASVAFDAKHNVWLASSIPITPSTLVVPVVFISRSTDGGQTWNAPVSIPAPTANKVNLDKNWSVCDDTPSSPHYGNCYTEFDNPGQTDLEYMSTSTDGGLTWSQPVSPTGNPHGLGGQPVVQPNGTVIVPFETITGKEAAFSSTDGGASWGHAATIANIAFNTVGGGLRTSPLPSAEIDGAGKVFVAWEDCRFRAKCSSNDIVFSTSSDGVTWSPVTRVPIDPVTSGADHFIPGLAVDKATSGSTAHLALTYYYYPDATCNGGCQLDVGFISSTDGGLHWSAPTPLAGPTPLFEIANTSQGRMVGDYISTSFNASGTAATVFALGLPQPSPSTFDEAMYAPTTPLSVASGATPATAGPVLSTGGTGTGALLQSTRKG